MNPFTTRFLTALLLAIPACAIAEEGEVTGSGVVIGYHAPAHEARKELELAVADASRLAGHPIALFINPRNETGTSDQQAEKFAGAWPGRTIVVVNVLPSRDIQLAIRPIDAVQDRFDAPMRKRFDGEVAAAMLRGQWSHAIARVVREVGATAGGKTVEKWNPWKHPIQALTGGKDASDDERLNAFIEFLFGLGFLGLFFWWLWMFTGNPRAALGALFMAAVDVGASAAAGSASGGSGGGGMSGGGGSFDGGGASGSW
jgi:uncharacterized protein